MLNVNYFKGVCEDLGTYTVIDLFSALCAKLFQNGVKFFKYFFFLLSAHFNKLLYIEGNEFKG